MKKIILILLASVALTGCRSCMANYEQRRKGVQAVCPNCIYTVSEGMHFAQDTSKKPNN